MNNVLLLGNGMNRISDGYSWDDLIAKLISRFCHGNVNHNLEYRKPFPLLYEEILSYALMNKTGTENIIKNFIKEEIEKIDLNDSHTLIKDADFLDILTTNYDATIEKAIGGDVHFYIRAQVEEQRYSLFRKKVADGIPQSVWHIHGEAPKPNTITLGYEQYAGYLQNIRESVFVGNKYKNFQLSALWDRLETDTIHTWIDFFFSHHVHIVGLSLDFSEMDLWWLLVYRSRHLNNQLEKKSKYQIRNRLYYYYAKSPKLNMHETSRLEILESLDVTLVPFELRGDDYQRFYKELFEKGLRI
jgi:hypothetical protein